MISIEQVEKLLEYADVTFEEARDALEHCDGKLLDAIVHLERKGKVAPRGAGARTGAVTVLPGNAQEEKEYRQPKDSFFADGIKKFFKWVGEEFDKLSRCYFVASRKGSDLVSMPALIFWGIVIFGFYFSVITLLVGLACGVKYRFDHREEVVTENNEENEESEKL